MLKGIGKILFSLLVSFLVFSIAPNLALPAFADTTQCQQQTISVTLSPLDSTQYQMVTWLCWEGNLQGKTLQIVIHGVTYDHNYWDFPYQGSHYSYVTKALDQGYAVLNLDRIGAGLSDHPNDTLVSLTSGAYTIHQLITDLRTGIFANTLFSKIILVGHSGGSGIAILDASTYQDVDGIILSGFGHVLNPAGFTLVANDFYPAILDPKFANSGYTPGYITTKPGTRGQLFYDLSNADPNVVSLDETLKQAGTAEELADLPHVLLPSVSLSVHVPVLIALGQFDALGCGGVVSCADAATILGREQPFFNPDACLEAFVLPNSGHDINLHLNSHDWYTFANDWANRRIGNSATNPPIQPCL